jgi:hypothetical protein
VPLRRRSSKRTASPPRRSPRPSVGKSWPAARRQV